MSRRTTIGWVAVALVGLLLAGGASLLVREVTTSEVGLGGEPITAGEELAPPAVDRSERRRERRRAARRRARRQRTSERAPAPSPAPVVPAPALPPVGEVGGDDDDVSGDDDDSGRGRGRGRGRSDGSGGSDDSDGGSDD